MPRNPVVKLPRGKDRLSFEPVEHDWQLPPNWNGNWRICPAIYNKGKVLVQCPGFNGFKTRAARLSIYVGGRYVNRSKGYVMSPAAAERFSKLYFDGFDTDLYCERLIPPGGTE